MLDCSSGSIPSVVSPCLDESVCKRPSAIVAVVDISCIPLAVFCAQLTGEGNHYNNIAAKHLTPLPHLAIYHLVIRHEANRYFADWQH